MHSEQAAPDLLQKSLDASGVGWWQLDFGQRGNPARVIRTLTRQDETE